MATHRTVRNVLLIEGSANLLVFVAKLVAGIAAGSSAIIADALHSLVDIANNGLALFASKLSESPPDHDHPYGHKKFEWLAIFVLATLLSVMAIEIAIRAIERSAHEITLSPLSLTLMLLVLAVNVTLATWQRRWSKRLNSELLKADAHHTLGDAFTTAVILLGSYFASRGFPWVDTVLALVVALLVLYLALGLFKRAIPILVDESGVDVNAVNEAILALPGVEEVKRVRSRRVGPDIFADVVVSVSANLETSRSHEIADAVEHCMTQEMAIADVVVHIEPKL